MKPFDLQKALAGDPVITRDGRPVTQLTHFDGVSGQESVFGLIDGRVGGWHENGDYFLDEEHANDLFMLTKTKEGWINVYQTMTGAWRAYGPIYVTEREALDHNGGGGATIRIEWEVP